LPSARCHVERAIRDLGGDPALRMAVHKDGPVVTDHGELVFDVRFDASVDLRAVDQALHRIPGIIETGLFFDMAEKVLVGCGGAGNLSLKTLTR
jgi:ribose 5-phosphate isomerase A